MIDPERYRGIPLPAGYHRWRHASQVAWQRGVDAALAVVHARTFHRPDQHDPANWTPLPDGSWRSPTGRRYRADAAVVAKVRARREELGITL